MARALVTGGSGSIGAEICRQLRAAGHHVYVHGHEHLDRAEALAQDLTREGGSAAAIGFNVANHEESKQAVEDMLSDGPLQIAVHNAGIYLDGPMAGMSLNQWQNVIDVSLNGFFNVIQPLLLPMLRTRWGRIILVSSVSALVGNRGQVNYSAAKAGLHGAAKSLARECASRGVTVNVVAPGLIDTPDIVKQFSIERVKQLVPMERMGRVDEVAKLVGFLASEDAGYVTGQIISLNGGMA